MPFELQGEIFNVEDGTGKNGYWANIIIQNNQARKKVEIFTKDQQNAKEFIKLIGQNVKMIIQLNQSKFGLNFGEIESFVVVPAK